MKMELTRNEYRTRIFESDMSGYAKLVCLAIMEYAGYGKTTCYPSQDTIAQDCSISRNTVRAATKEAQNAGYFTTELIRPKHARFSIIEYTFPYVECAAHEQSNAQRVEQSVDLSNERSPAAQEPYKPIEPVKPKKIITKKVFSKPENVSDDVWQDFLLLRKEKKAAVTKTALEGIQREADKLGWTLQQALKVCCARGWQGFNASWVQKDQSTNQQGENTNAITAKDQSRRDAIMRGALEGAKECGLI